MTSKRRIRERRPARRKPWRNPKPRILCVCEGEKTEPQYFRSFIEHCRNPRVQLEIVPGPGVPRTLVERAKQRKRTAQQEARRQRDTNLAFDEVWCVHDVDEHPRLDEARVMAEDNDILLAVSNPCFELWLLLHFRDSPGPQHRDEMLRITKTFLHNYDKGVCFSDLAKGYELAVERAHQLDKMAEQDGQPGRNPTTGVWRLTRSIRGDHPDDHAGDMVESTTPR